MKQDDFFEFFIQLTVMMALIVFVLLAYLGIEHLFRLL